MASNIKFTDNSIEVTEQINKGLRNALREVAAEIVRQARINSRVSTGETRKKYSYRTQETVNGFVAYIGSNYKNAIWEEFGTGEYALNGNGRPGYWVYVKSGSDDKKKDKPVGKIYTLKEAKQVMAILRSKGLDAYYTKGKKPTRALFRAFNEHKEKYIEHLKIAVDE